MRKSLTLMQGEERAESATRVDPVTSALTRADFLDVLRREYYQPETAPKLWEDLLAEHLRELPPIIARLREISPFSSGDFCRAACETC